MLTIGSLFSGIGGLELGLEMAGLGPVVWQVEQDPFCRSVLAKHWSDVDRSVTDVREAGATSLIPVDLICGGFPCQDVSAAGKGAGLAGSRSGLWFEFARVVGALRPSFVVVENVASGAVRWVDTVVAGLGSLGYQALPVPLSAQDVGAPHLRRRIFIIAHTNCEPVRKQSGRRGRSEGEGEAIPQHDGEKRFVANAKGLRLSDGRQEMRSAAHCGRSEISHGVGKDWAMANADSNGSLPTEHRTLQTRTGATGEQACAEDCSGGLQRRYGGRPIGDPWAIEPDVGRVADGIPNRVDRIKALGNAVVPQCAEVIGYMVIELDKARQGRAAQGQCAALEVRQ